MKVRAWSKWNSKSRNIFNFLTRMTAALKQGHKAVRAWAKAWWTHSRRTLMKTTRRLRFLDLRFCLFNKITSLFQNYTKGYLNRPVAANKRSSFPDISQVSKTKSLKLESSTCRCKPTCWTVTKMCLKIKKLNKNKAFIILKKLLMMLAIT